MKKQTIKRQIYSVTAQNDCQVTATIDGTIYTLLDLKAGEQKTFVAIADEVEISDEKAVILPFDNAPAIIEKVAASGGESGGNNSKMGVFPWELIVNFQLYGRISLTENYPTGYYSFDLSTVLEKLEQAEKLLGSSIRPLFCWNRSAEDEFYSANINGGGDYSFMTIYHEQGKFTPIVEIPPVDGHYFCYGNSEYAPGELIIRGWGVYNSDPPILTDYNAWAESMEQMGKNYLF